MQVSVTKIIADAVQLPSPPQVMSRLLSVVADPNHSARGVAQTIKLDPIISAATLRIANSAAAGARVRIGSIDRALVSIGEAELVRLVISQAAKCLRKDRVAGYGHNSGGLWRKSVFTALACEQIARGVDGVVPTVAYATGLLVDVGKLALGSYLEERRHDVIAGIEAASGAFDGAERNVFGIDHAELGAKMAEAWSFPSDVVSAIRYHHRPSEAGEHKPLAFVVHVADSLAMMAGGGAGVDGLQYPMDPRWSDAISMTAYELEHIMVSVSGAAAALMESVS